MNNFITAEDAAKVFEGCKLKLSTMRVILPNGKEVKRAQFKVLFGGYTYALDRENIKVTRDPWKAFVENQTFRPTII